MSTSFDKGYALLIGVSDQENPKQASKLPETAKDVKTLAAILQDPKKSGYLKENVKTLLGKEATRKNMLKGISWLKKKLEADPSATAIVYYSGHGYRKKDLDKYYLIPYDFDFDMLEDSALEDSIFSDRIGAINAKRLLLLLDCCHAGDTDAGIASEGLLPEAANINTFIDAARAKPVTEDEKNKKNPNGSKPVTEDEKNKKNPNGSKPVTEDEKNKKNPNGSKPTNGEQENNAQANGTDSNNTRAVLVSSRGNELSYVHTNKEIGMSIFTYHLIEALNGHGKSKNEDTTVNVLDVMSHVLDSVPGTTLLQYGQSQTPNARYYGENFPIALLMGGEGLPTGQQLPTGTQIINNIKHIAGDNFEEVNITGDFVQGNKITVEGNDRNPFKDEFFNQ